VGLVVGLDYHDPFLDPHALFQRFKEHPLLKGLLAGGKMERTGRAPSARAAGTRSRVPMPTACFSSARRPATERPAPEASTWR
jgi:flavin-dependent dehydrogenase